MGIEGQPFAPIAGDDEQEIAKLFEDKEADLILFGHNHRFTCLMVNLPFILILVQ